MEMKTMFEHEPNSGGMTESIGRLGSSLIGLLGTRAELLAVELEEAKHRAIRLLVRIVVAITIGVAGLLVAIGALALFFWEMAGYWGLIGLAAGTIGLAAIILKIIHRRITDGPVLFEGTVAEFKRDAECLRQQT
jgi:uncharacterized membrane protein YqjE